VLIIGCAFNKLALGCLFDPFRPSSGHEFLVVRRNRRYNPFAARFVSDYITCSEHNLLL